MEATLALMLALGSPGGAYRPLPGPGLMARPPAPDEARLRDRMAADPESFARAPRRAAGFGGAVQWRQPDVPEPEPARFGFSFSFKLDDVR